MATKNFYLMFFLIRTALLSFLLVFTSHFIFAQSNSPAPVSFPVVNLVGSDGKAFNSAELLSKEKPTIVVYFSPTCGACEEQTKTITSNMADLEEVQFLFVTSYAPADTEPFLEDHRIGSFGNIRFGYDTKSAMGQHYRLEKVPAVYLYNAEGKLQQEWNGFASAEVLKAAVDGKSLVSTPLNQDLNKNVNLLEGCPERKPIELHLLCEQLEHNLEDPETGIPKYVLTLKELACVPKGASEEEMKAKAQAWWDINKTKIQCHLNRRNLNGQNILKFAVNFLNKQFLIDLVDTFDLDLNFKDTDGRTVLEYCLSEVTRLTNSNSPQGTIDYTSEICTFIEEANKRRK
jgi:thiol-disulfide isomerase/thioredoxin